MADTRLTLGSFSFRDFEIPEKIDFGVEQRLGVHELVGGDEVIDRMGRKYKPIRWKGQLRGKNAASRARTLQAFAESGAEMPVSWGSYTFLVCVRSFEQEYERFYEIPYRIELKVIPNGGLFGAIASLTSLVSADVGALSKLGGLL